MRKHLTIVCALLVFSAFVCASGSLVMLRCDNNGKQEFLNSPSDVDLSQLQASFNPNVDTIVFVHGFNNTYDSCKSSYSQSISHLKGQLGDRNYVGFHWPSNTGLLAFGKAVDHANQTGRYLVYVLGQVTRWYGSKSGKIHLIGHSLGARVMLSTLQQNEARYVKWGSCFPWAGAVHSNSFVNNFKGTNELPQYTFVYYSDRDSTLKYLYALYYWLFEKRGFERDENYLRWNELSDEGKLAYIEQIDTQAKNNKMPESEFDMSLYASIQRAEKDAMGLVGAIVNGSSKVQKVENLDMTSIISGHSDYWNNTSFLNQMVPKLK